ncbi:MAG: hypothetical protein DRP68_07185, partial [Candidatus Omnitrophota bacterium]
ILLNKIEEGLFFLHTIEEDKGQLKSKFLVAVPWRDKNYAYRLYEISVVWLDEIGWVIDDIVTHFIEIFQTNLYLWDILSANYLARLLYLENIPLNRVNIQEIIKVLAQAEEERGAYGFVLNRLKKVLLEKIKEAIEEGNYAKFLKYKERFLFLVEYKIAHEDELINLLRDEGKRSENRHIRKDSAFFVGEMEKSSLDGGISTDLDLDWLRRMKGKKDAQESNLSSAMGREGSGEFYYRLLDLLSSQITPVLYPFSKKIAKTFLRKRDLIILPSLMLFIGSMLSFNHSLWDYFLPLINAPPYLGSEIVEVSIEKLTHLFIHHLPSSFTFNPVLKDMSVVVQRDSSFSLKKEFGNIDIVSYDGGEVSHLIEALRDEDRYVRYKAAEELDRIGWQPKNQEEKILYLIVKQTWDELVKIGVPAVPYLIEVLKDKDLYVRKAAVKALGEIGSQEIASHLRETIIEALIEVLIKDESWDVRYTSAYVLIRIGSPAVPYLIKVLKDKEKFVRQVTAGVLGEIGAQEAVPYLIGRLKDEDEFVRLAAAKALEKIGSQEIASHLRETIIEALIETLKDEDWRVHLGAAEALGEIGSPAIPHLIKALRDKDWRVRYRVRFPLGEIGSPAIPHLIEVLKDKDSDVRKAAAEALRKIGWRPQNQEEEILYLIANPGWDELVEIGVPAIPYLIEALKDKDSNVRKAAVEALGKIDSKKAVPPLIEALKDENWDVRSTAAEVLGKIGSQEAIPHLIETLKNENNYVRYKAAEALVKIGPPAIFSLIEALKHEYWYVRQAAVYALGGIGSQKAVPPLIEALKDEDWHVRLIAAKALGGISSEKAILHLIEALKDENNYVRQVAAEALGKIGAQEAIPYLIEVLKDESWDVRKAAAEALRKIGWRPQNQEEEILYLIAKHDWDGLVRIDSSAVPYLIETLNETLIREEDLSICSSILTSFSKMDV